MADKIMGGKPFWRQHAITVGVAVIAAIFGLATALVVLGREKTPSPAPIVSSSPSGADPAAANLADPGTQVAFAGAQQASASKSVRVLPASAAYTPQQSGESYPAGQQAPAPIVRGNPSQNESLNYNTQPPVTDNGQAPAGNFDPNAPTADPGYADAQENAGYEALEQTDQAPPPLPDYEQPPAPDDNYLWTPGYWGYNTGYYWVPGAWVAPPFYGALWTPPFWGWYGGRYLFHRGYWGNHIGYYGGINYGYGYVGTGFYGGYWQGRNFYYNRSVTNVNVSNVRNVYERPVVINNVTYGGRPLNRTSFNGPGGVRYQAHPYEIAAMREPHYAPVAAQVQSRQVAASNRAQFFSDNHGRPAEAFHQRPLSSPSNIAATPGRSPVNQTQFNQRPQNQPANTLRNTPQNTPQNNSFRQPAPGSPGLNRPGADGALRNGVLQSQHDQQLGGQREAADQQRNLQLQQQEQRNFQVQQTQQRQAADQQRTQQLQQGQQRAQPFQQPQHDAADQQRNLQFQQQQQRNQQMQQQRQAADPQRNLQFQQQQRLQQPQSQPRFQPQAQPQTQPQTQRIEARPAAPQAQPQHVEAPRASPQPHAEAPHGAPAGGERGHPR